MWVVAVALAAPRVDRIDVVSDDPGRFLAVDLPRAGLAPETTAVRFAAQVGPVLALGAGWQLGISASSQALRREWPLGGEWHANVGVSTHYGLPRGALAGIALRTGRVRLGISLAAMSGATWVDRDWSTWTFGPALAVGVTVPERAPWMRGRNGS